MKKLLPLLLMLLLLLLTGCAAPADNDTDHPAPQQNDANTQTDAYPVLEEVTEMRLKALEPVEADLSTCTFSHPGRDWAAAEEDGIISVLHYSDELYDGARVNVSLGGRVTIFQSHSIDETTARTIVEQIEAENAGHTIEVQELRTFQGETVFYAELLTEYSDAWLDSLLDSGALTEEELELAGGREVVTAREPIYQIYIAAVADDTVVFCTGVYTDEARKDMVLETMLVVLSTLEVK